MSDHELSDLNALIEQFRNHKITPAEFHKQKIGWIVGNADEGLRLTPAEAEALLVD